MKTHPSRGSHLPVMINLFQMSTGPIVELGCGMYSTCYLHWACYPTKRKLLTLESNEKWIEFAKQFQSDFHDVRFVADWEMIDLSDPWAIALVDHAPDERRINEIQRLVHADFVVIHDAENKREKKYRYSTVYPLFRYRYKYTEASPHTMLLSNKHDITNFAVR